MLNEKFAVIPSIREMKHFEYALSIPGEYVLLSTVAHIGNLQLLTERCHQANKKVLVNHELIGGLGADSIAFEMLKKLYQVDVVIGMNPQKVNKMKEVGLSVTLRIPLMDSVSIDSALRMIKATQAEAIELRPSICALDFLPLFRRQYKGKIFTCGFVNSEKMLRQLYDAGFDGVMTSTRELWSWRPSAGK